MKLLSNILSFTLLATLLWSCGFDNYDEPKSKLYGKVTYNGEALGLRGTGEAIQMQLYQDGFELRDPITVYMLVRKAPSKLCFSMANINW